MKDFCDECLKLNQGLYIDDWDLCDDCLQELEAEFEKAACEVLCFSDTDVMFIPESRFQDD